MSVRYKHGVASLVEAWIETPEVGGDAAVRGVASLVEAWIETGLARLISA